MRSKSPGERSPRVLAWQSHFYRDPKRFQSRRRHAHAPHAVQTARHEPQIGDLARDRTVFFVELDLGHPLPDFGQPPMLRSALPRRPCSVRVETQGARVRDNPNAERLRRRGQ